MSPTAAFPLSEVYVNQDRNDLTASTSGQPSASAIAQLRPITRQRQLLVLVTSFLTTSITIGFNQSYGVFQSYYISPTQTMLPNTTSNNGALVAFVGTLGSGLTWGGSIAVNPIMARLGIKGTRYLRVIGVLCMSLGFGLASLSTQVGR